MRVELIEIAERFRGPPTSGNGGYVCGLIARFLQGTVSVRLRAPPPLNVGLRLESTDEEARLFHDTAVIAEARRSLLELKVPPCPSHDEAERAAHSFTGFKKHAFPGCFVCGPEREPGDGLRIFPGPVNESSLIAAPWNPEASLADESGSVRPEFLWAALDCTGGFAARPVADDRAAALVLGELCASIAGEVAPGEQCVVIGWPLGAQGRKRLVGSAVYAVDGRLVAQARGVWIEVSLDTWAMNSGRNSVN